MYFNVVKKFIVVHLIVFISISLTFFSFAEDVNRMNSLDFCLIRNLKLDSTFAEITEKAKSKSGTILAIRYGHGNKNLYADKFDEIQLSLLFKSEYGSLELYWGYLKNVQKGYGCCECPNDTYYRSYRFMYDIGNIGVLFELNEKYYGAGLSINYFMIGERWCNLSGLEQLVLPKIWLNIGWINRYYLTLGFVDHIPLTVEEAPLSAEVTYHFNDPFSKISFRKIGILESNGYAIETEFRVFKRLLIMLSQQYYLEIYNYADKIQKDVSYFRLGIGYIFGL